jgi:SagB-type dehydrogenase family enzyme
MSYEYQHVITLPPPSTRGRVSVEEALATRRSLRAFVSQPLSEVQLSQLLWSLQGITGAEGYRTTPSAGALYPLEIFVVLADGFHRYEPRGHRLGQIGSRDLRDALAEAALGQEELAQAPATFVIAAVYERSERKYGHARGERYTILEAGHAAQNLLLMATALGLASVPVAAFEDGLVHDALHLDPEHEPVYLVPVGLPAPERG